MKKLFLKVVSMILLVSILVGCAGSLNPDATTKSNGDTTNTSMSSEEDSNHSDVNVEIKATGDIDDEESSPQVNNKSTTVESIPADSKYEISTIASFNDDGYAWIVLTKSESTRIALLNSQMDICCILPIDYYDISMLHPFELDFNGNGSTLVELTNGEKYIINEGGEITYTLDTEEYDDISFGSKGCYLVSKTYSGYDDYGTDYGIIDANGEVILPLMRVSNMKDVGSGVFAFNGEVGLNRGLIFYNAKTDLFFQIYDLKPTYLFENEGDIFFDGVARVQLGSGRMQDPVALTYADTGNTVGLDIQTEYAFYDYGPIADGGFIYYSHSYEGNRGEVVSSIGFYDLETGVNFPIFNEPERIIYESIRNSLRKLKFIDGYVALELLGADGKTYYSIVNKVGEVVYGPQDNILSIQNKGEGYFMITTNTGTAEIINVNGKNVLNNLLNTSSFSKGYAADYFSNHYIDTDGNEAIIEIPEE